jgi:hypothetical protein
LIEVPSTRSDEEDGWVEDEGMMLLYISEVVGLIKVSY